MSRQAPEHIEHTDDCMSADAERKHAVVKMGPQTIEMNHRLHMQDVWYESGKSRKAPRPAHWPTDDHMWCAYMHGLDVQYLTTADSPMHHDNGCPIHARAKHHPNLDDANRVRLEKVA